MATAASASGGSTERPRLVWATTPVALITRRSDGETAVSTSFSTQGASWAGVRAAASLWRPPSMISRRRRSMTVRTAATTTSRG